MSYDMGRKVSTSSNTSRVASGQAPSKVPTKKATTGLKAKASAGLKGGFVKAGYGKGTVRR